MPRLSGRARLLLLLGYLAIGAVRLALAHATPGETTDVLRNLGYGRAFWSYGLTVYDRTPGELGPPHGWEAIWSEHTFDYPIVALAFYAALAAVSTSLVVARVVFSAIELANALLVARLTRSHWLGLVTFASPTS